MRQLSVGMVRGGVSLRVLCGVAALLSACACGRHEQIQAKQESGPVRVESAPVSVLRIQRVVQSVGTLFPYEEAIISAEVEGRVDQVRADLGDRVTKGQLLARLSDEEQRYLLAQNEAQLRMTMERIGLKSERDRISDVRESSEVRRAQADLTDAEQRYKRVRSLVDQGIGAAADLDEAQARYQSLQAGYDQSLNQVRNLLQDVERAKASLELQRKKLRDTSILAPFDSLVKERVVTAGQYVQTNTPLFTLVRIDPVRLRLEIPERMAPWIRNGQVASVTVEAFGDRHFSGKVWRISPTVDQAKRTFIVEALIANPQGELKPGSYARAVVPTSKTESIRLIPRRAVNYIFGANRAYILKNGVVEARELKMGDIFEERVEVLEGINLGERVATTQLTRLDTGTRVTDLRSE